jgi:hypothetical protein
VTPWPDTGHQVPRLTQADVEAIAECVVEQMKEALRPQLWFGLADAVEVARRLHVRENWVYAHADEQERSDWATGRRPDSGSIASAWRARSASPRRGEAGGGLGGPRSHGLPAGVRLIEGRGS